MEVNVPPSAVIPAQKNVSRLRLFALTVFFLGVQFHWTIQLGYGTPFLLSLGMDKAGTAAVQLSGPIAGIVIQPIVGALTDHCRSRLGRRRPTVIFGTIIVVLSMASMAFAREIGGLFSSDNTGPLVVAVVAFFMLDFSDNAVQVACRALIADLVPLQQQREVNAFLGVQVGVGYTLGYGLGFIDLPGLTGVDSQGAQMKILSVIAAGIFTTCMTITALTGREASSANMERNKTVSPYTIALELVNCIRYLPTYVSKICRVQFWAWAGWYPLLCYCTTWVAQFHADNHHPFQGPQGESAARIGSLALLCFSFLSLVTSAIVPVMHSKQALCLGRKIVSIPNIWTISIILFAVLGLSTFWVYSGTVAMTVMVLFGISFGIANWLPFALIGEWIVEQEILRKVTAEPQEHLQLPAPDDDEEAPLLVDPVPVMTTPEVDISAGLVIGVHNIAMCVPQLLGLGACALLFAFLDRNDGGYDPDDHMYPGDSGDSIGWALRAGAVCALVSAWLSTRVKELRKPKLFDEEYE